MAELARVGCEYWEMAFVAGYNGKTIRTHSRRAVVKCGLEMPRRDFLLAVSGVTIGAAAGLMLPSNVRADEQSSSLFELAAKKGGAPLPLSKFKGTYYRMKTT